MRLSLFALLALLCAVVTRAQGVEELDDAGKEAANVIVNTLTSLDAVAPVSGIPARIADALNQPIIEDEEPVDSLPATEDAVDEDDVEVAADVDDAEPDEEVVLVGEPVLLEQPDTDAINDALNVVDRVEDGVDALSSTASEEEEDENQEELAEQAAAEENAAALFFSLLRDLAVQSRVVPGRAEQEQQQQQQQPLPVDAPRGGVQPQQLAGVSHIVLALSRTVQQGTQLFNSGRVEQCAALYMDVAQRVAVALSAVGEEAGAAATMEAVERALLSESPVDAAWLLRRHFDQLLRLIRSSPAYAPLFVAHSQQEQVQQVPQEPPCVHGQFVVAQSIAFSQRDGTPLSRSQRILRFAEHCGEDRDFQQLVDVVEDLSGVKENSQPDHRVLGREQYEQQRNTNNNNNNNAYDDAYDNAYDDGYNGDQWHSHSGHYRRHAMMSFLFWSLCFTCCLGACIGSMRRRRERRANLRRATANLFPAAHKQQNSSSSSSSAAFIPVQLDDDEYPPRKVSPVRE